MTEQMKNQINTLVANAKIAYVSSIDETGHPKVKAMLSLQHDGLFTHYFSTNYSSRRTRELLENPKACVYFCDEPQFMGLMLTGEIKVLTDLKHKSMLWREGFEMYYPDGIETQDYCVYEFTAYKANYYHGLENTDFVKEDYENAEL